MRLLHLLGEAPGNIVRTCYTFSNTLEKDSPANANHTLTFCPLFKAIVRDPQLLLAETFRTCTGYFTYLFQKSTLMLALPVLVLCNRRTREVALRFPACLHTY